MHTSLQAKTDAAIAEQERAADTNHSATEHLAPADLPSLIKHYGGTLAPAFAEEIRHIDHTLNEEHPTWNSTKRRERSWAKKPMTSIWAIKFLINRRAQIVSGNGQWGLVLASRGESKPPQVIPVSPSNRNRKSNPAAFERVLSVPLLASEAGVSTGKARRILATEGAQKHKGAMVDYVREAAAAEPKPAPAKGGAE